MWTPGARQAGTPLLLSDTPGYVSHILMCYIPLLIGLLQPMPRPETADPPACVLQPHCARATPRDR